jgi:hypothetical protein
MHKILAESLVLKTCLIQFPSILVEVISDRFVSLINVQFSAHAMILFVKEVDLIRQFLSYSLVCLLLVLHVQALQVLSTLVELTQSKDFRVSGLDLSILTLDSRL